MRHLFPIAAAVIALAGAGVWAASESPQATPGTGPQQVGANTQQGNAGNGLQFRGRRGYCGGQGQCVGGGRGMGRGLRLGPQDGSGPRRDGSCLRN